MSGLAELFLQPKTFNCIVMVLYGINGFWWLYHGSKADFFYWMSALAITATVTFGYER